MGTKVSDFVLWVILHMPDVHLRGGTGREGMPKMWTSRVGGNCHVCRPDAFVLQTV